MKSAMSSDNGLPANIKIEAGVAMVISSSFSLMRHYEVGARIIIHKQKRPSKGKRCVVRFRQGECQIADYAGVNQKEVILHDINSNREIRYTRSLIEWVAPVIGVAAPTDETFDGALAALDAEAAMIEEQQAKTSVAKTVGGIRIGIPFNPRAQIALIKSARREAKERAQKQRCAA